MQTSACPSDGSFESVQSLVEEGKTTREALESVAAEMDLTPTALRGRYYRKDKPASRTMAAASSLGCRSRQLWCYCSLTAKNTPGSLQKR